MALDELNEELREKHLIGYWTIPNTSTGFREPEPSFGPFYGSGGIFAPPSIKPPNSFAPKKRFAASSVTSTRHLKWAPRIPCSWARSGTTRIGEQRFDWQQGDSFVLPLWQWHSHENNSKEPAILFSINDRPAIEALGLFREEARA
jgi:Cupin domain